jgi:hypothetical protein
MVKQVISDIISYIRAKAGRRPSASTYWLTREKAPARRQGPRTRLGGTGGCAGPHQIHGPARPAFQMVGRAAAA